MKIRMASKVAIIVLGIGIMVASCMGKKETSSRVTGWKYNDKKGTGFTVKDKYESKVPPGMVSIEGGTYTIGEKGEYVTAPRDNKRRRITVSSFFMDQTEIRTRDWREYVKWMDIVFFKTAPNLVQKAKADETVWREELAYNEPYLANYFEHPAFDQYPIVGVTWEQATDYCAWRTDRVNEMVLVSQGYIKPADFNLLEKMSFDSIRDYFVFNTQKYLLQGMYDPEKGSKKLKDLKGNPRKVELTDGILFYDYRLPTESEWEFAAFAIVGDETAMVPEGKIYPWSGAQMRNPKKKNRGDMQANFVRGRGDMMGTSGALNDRATITTAVNAYWPNNFGLYNMAGNVNEWIFDVYRPTSYDDIAEYNSFRGNIYTEPRVNGVDSLGRNTYAMDSLGRVINDSVMDVRNYGDGDNESQINFTLSNPDDWKKDTMDITDVMRPEITEKTRVYKGGSWKDRVYWIDPSTRRYLEQDKCTNDIGFRCAMSMVGSIDQLAKK